ncbi:MAG: hypothetical protein WCJ84_05230 [Candidatus Peregrinibacteria bacterium]
MEKVPNRHMMDPSNIRKKGTVPSRRMLDEGNMRNPKPQKIQDFQAFKTSILSDARFRAENLPDNAASKILFWGEATGALNGVMGELKLACSQFFKKIDTNFGTHTPGDSETGGIRDALSQIFAPIGNPPHLRDSQISRLQQSNRDLEGSLGYTPGERISLLSEPGDEEE